MDELKFIFKTLMATMLMIALMQIKLGEKTIESRAYHVLAESAFAGFLNDVARGTVHLGKQAKQQIQEQIKKFNSP